MDPAYLEFLRQIGESLAQAALTLARLLGLLGSELAGLASAHLTTIGIVIAFYAGYRLFLAGITSGAPLHYLQVGAYRHREQPGSLWMKFFGPGTACFAAGVALLLTVETTLISTVLTAFAVVGGVALVVQGYRVRWVATDPRDSESRPTLLSRDARAIGCMAAGLLIALLSLASLNSRVRALAEVPSAAREAQLEAFDQRLGELVDAIESVVALPTEEQGTATVQAQITQP